MINCIHANSWLVCDLRLDKDLPECLCVLLDGKACKEMDDYGRQVIDELFGTLSEEEVKKFQNDILEARRASIPKEEVKE